jgi:mannose-1-phosphate guanylyltransferase
VAYQRVDGCCWQDIGTPEDYLELHRRLLQGSPQPWVISNQAHLATGLVLKDWGVLGARVRVGEGVQLTRCIVWDDVAIPPGRELTDQIISTGVCV